MHTVQLVQLCWTNCNSVWLFNLILIIGFSQDILGIGEFLPLLELKFLLLQVPGNGHGWRDC